MRLEKDLDAGTSPAGRFHGRSVAWRRRVVAYCSVLAAGLIGLPLAGSAATAATASSSTALYVVTDQSTADSSAASADVATVGGVVIQSDDTAQSVEAILSTAEVQSLNTVSGVVVTVDNRIAVQDASTTTSGRAPAAVFPQESGATQLWQQGDTGQNVNVAVVDTGIDNLPDFAGRLVGGVDLSGEGNPYLDSYGHGTFVAGLIAGNGASSNGAYTGEAPGAGLVSVKVAGASGQTDLATVMAGINWVIKNRGAYHIKVVNLSFGMVPFESTVLNPLDQAVEAAWKAGIVVVAAAGNAGPFNGTIMSPGDDPLVITPGALDDLGTPATSDDAMTTFSSVGPTNPDGWAKPDLVASGRSVVSLRAPGSTVDEQNPSARVGTANFVGSGTSFSTAITSAAAALVLDAVPGASPDTVKGRLLAGAAAGPVGNPWVDGHGMLNLPGALAMGPGNSFHLHQQTPKQATPYGSTVSLADTWASSAWNPANYSCAGSSKSSGGGDDSSNDGQHGSSCISGSSWNGSSWNGSSWNGSSWNGSSWNGSSWNGSSWNGSSWNGFAWGSTPWNGSSWNGSAWNGSAWNGSSWNGSAWNGSSWNGSSWNGGSWNGSAWNGGSWNGGAWNGGSWNGSAWN
jgi:serine protease AprX